MLEGFAEQSINADLVDPSTFANLRNLTRDGWAWEFLRRNHAYAEAGSALSTRNKRLRRWAKGIETVDGTGMGQIAPWGLNFLRGARSSR